MTSWTQPTDDQVARAAARLTDPAHRRYFLDKLRNPLWIKPLAERGFFSDPPPPIIDEGNDRITFPVWPASRYLARAAEDAPEDAVAATAAIPASDNPTVLLDRLHVALAVPPASAAELARPILEEFRRQRTWARMATGDLCKLGRHLATSSEHPVGIRVLKAAFAVSAEESPSGIRRSCPAMPMERWSYARLLDEELVPTVVHIGSAGLDLLLNLLRDAFEIESNDRGTGYADSSHSLISQLDESAASVRSDVLQPLVSATRDAIRELKRKNLLDDRAAITALLRHQRGLFARLAMDYLADQSSPDAECVRELLLDRAFFDEASVRREYSQLLEAQRNALSDDDVANIVAWIDEGVDTTRWQKNHQLITGNELTPEDIQARIRRWRSQRLLPLKGRLAEPHASELQRLVAEFGDQADYHGSISTGGSWRGWKSPLETNEILRMEDFEVLEFLRAWQPPEPQGLLEQQDSAEGLANNLKAAAAEMPDRFSVLAPRLAEVDRTYAEAVLRGLEEVVRQGGWFDVRGGLRLAAICAETPGEPDALWGHSVALTCARLVFSLLTARGGELAGEFGEQALQIIELLVRHPDPTEDSETAAPMEQALNCVRGEALNAAVSYCLWAKRVDERILRRDLPKIERVLEERLDPDSEPTLAVHSIFGRWLPWLYLVDRSWTESVKGLIFPHLSEDRWRAAWSAYIVLCAPYDDILLFLRTEYQKGVQCLGSWSSERRVDRTVDERLVEHLMVFFLRGKLSIADELFELLWQKADANLHTHAVWFGGQVAQKNAETLAESVRSRLKDFWEFQIGRAESEMNQDRFRTAMRAFGYWFAKGQFEPRWALQEALRAAEIGGGLEYDHEILEVLTGLARQYPRECLRLLELMAPGDEWGSLQRGEAAVELVKEAAEAGAAEEARDVVNRLARSYGWFGLLRALPSE